MKRKPDPPGKTLFEIFANDPDAQPLHLPDFTKDRPSTTLCLIPSTFTSATRCLYALGHDGPHSWERRVKTPS